MKVALCIPVHGDTKTGFTLSLVDLVAHTMRARPDIEMPVTFARSASISYNRNELVRLALHDKADWLLWLDADHTFPKDALLRLLAHDKPVVACNYIQRLRGKDGSAMRPQFDGRAINCLSRAGGGLEEMAAVGMGVFLISADAIRSVPEPRFLEGYTRDGFRGEDVHFCNHLRSAGHKIYVDHDLSMEVGHIGETVLRF